MNSVSFSLARFVNERQDAGSGGGGKEQRALAERGRAEGGPLWKWRLDELTLKA